ncbi:unnamed protein product [Cunninghamella echinulata]
MESNLKTNLELHNHSSLGISQALKSTPTDINNEPTGINLTDNMLKEVNDQDNIFCWMRFMISLYYNKVAVNIFGCVTGWHWYDQIDKHILLGALPTPALIRDLKSRNQIGALINLCSEFPGFTDLNEELNILQIRLPTPDFTTPTLDTLHRGVDIIIDILNQQSSSIYIHCKAGRGRSATLVMCYLLKKYKLDPTQAQDIILNHRPQV